MATTPEDRRAMVVALSAAIQTTQDALQTAHTALEGARACLAALVGPEPPAAPEQASATTPTIPAARWAPGAPLDPDKCRHPVAIEVPVGGERTLLCPDCNATLHPSLDS